MGLLGGGDDSLAASSGWGVLPPINSSADWGSSSSTGGSSSANHWQSGGGSQSGSSAGNSVSASSAGSNSSSNGTVVARQNALSNHNSAASDQLSSSPKPSSSWAQAAGKGLVNTAASANGPSSSNSHETGPLGSSQLQCPSSQSSSAATNANLNGGLAGAMNANSSNISCSSSSAFQGGSNCNSSGGLSGGSSSNPIDAAAVNKQRAGPLAAGQISDLIGQLSDDFRETLLTEKWGSTVINQDSPWNLPPSPQSSPKDTSTWRCPSNSGTEIWENTVRQKKGSMGSSSASLSSSAGPAQPWGTAPTTHIGGTWGEEEDSSNHWTGVPQSSSLNSASGGNGLGVNTMAGPSGLSALGGASGVNSSSINPNWSAGSGLSNGAGSGISSYSLLNSAGLGASIGANSIGASDGPGANSWNGNDKSAFESRTKQPTNWSNFDQSDSVSESNWDKSGGNGNDNAQFGTWNAPESRKNEAGWDKESNDSFKGGVDDGTACWGNPGGGRGGGNVNHSRSAAPPNWKDQKYGNKNGYNNGGWNNGNNNGNNGNGGNKSTNQMLTRTWTDASGHRKSPSMWNDDTKSLNGNMTPSNWSDGQIDTSSWGASKASKPLTREMILSSKQFRLLIDLGHKKDDAENALRNCQLRFEDALAELENAKSLKNSAYGPMTMNKMPMSRNQMGPMLNTQSATNPNSLQHLVQRIQLAVSTGFLNPQILNQPLSNQNLEIISELLHQIKILKEVHTSSSLQTNGSIKQSFDYRIREIKQNIAQLQNQLRSEANAGGPGKVGLQTMDLFGKTNNTDLYGLTNDGGYNAGGPGAGSQGSRLFSWKHNKQQSNEDKMNPLGADSFIRAPGGLPKQNSTNWGNFMDDNSGWPAELNKHEKDDLAGGLDNYSLGGNFPVQDSFDSYKSTWKPTAKSGLVEDDPRSPISQNPMLKDSMFSWNSVGATNPNSKANTLLGGNGQGQLDPLNTYGFGGGSNNPWSYSGNGAQPTGGNSQIPFPADPKKNSMGGKSSSHTWSNQGLNSDYSDSLWNPGANSGNAGGSNVAGKPRPPPGLSKNSNSSSANSIWSSSSGSEYLRLRNLTPQIDGSTLKTLCLQHGPLHLFHLFLSHGTAIARYANREQAIKAQSALNNCVLGNTTILADLPPEAEVQQYLQLINGGGHSAQPSGGSSSNGTNGSGSLNHQAAQSSQPSHHQHHASHHSQAYNHSWSNGTNASQSTAGAGAGASAVQSTQQSHHAPSVSLYSRTSSVGSSGPNSVSVSAHLSPFGNSAAINSYSVQPTPSPASSMPYGATGAPGGLVTTHSYTALNQASAASAASQFNKMDNGLLSSWNTTSGSGGLWDSSLPGSAGGLWSTVGFSANDRNTPIQGYLPGDLLAGENN